MHFSIIQHWVHGKDKKKLPFFFFARMSVFEAKYGWWIMCCFSERVVIVGVGVGGLNGDGGEVWGRGGIHSRS